jgi:glucose-6-phosphate isomerase, archaeal
MEKMMHEPAQKTIMAPFTVNYDLSTGEMLNPKSHLIRRASDMRGHYADSGALEKLISEGGDPLHYEVFETPVPEEYGHLMYCISKLQPGRIGQEFFMTKGHYHTVSQTAEIYLCLGGEGYMLMKTSDGATAAEKMVRGAMVYVPPYWAHRSVNTGNTALVSFCVYPAEAGHNYGDIEQEGFGKRIMLKDGQAVIE